MHLDIGVHELDVPRAEPCRPLRPRASIAAEMSTPTTLAAGPDPGRQLQRRPARAAAQVDHALPGPQVQAIHGQLAGRPARLLHPVFELEPRRRHLRPELGLLGVGEGHAGSLRFVSTDAACAARSRVGAMLRHPARIPAAIFADQPGLAR